MEKYHEEEIYLSPEVNIWRPMSSATITCKMNEKHFQIVLKNKNTLVNRLPTLDSRFIKISDFVDALARFNWAGVTIK